MGKIYKTWVRNFLFRHDPEWTHDCAVQCMKYLTHCTGLCKIMSKINGSYCKNGIHLFGLRFPNAVGLAAGFDKNAIFWPAMAALGFGHVEVGTITGEKQPGNSKPRLFRYPHEEAIINRMGFNNDGAEIVANRLHHFPRKEKRLIPLGINIGKTKVVSLEHAIEDYLKSFRLLAPHADYIALNVSSPNTPGLRALQEKVWLSSLIKAIMNANTQAIPILLKIAPDLNYPQIDAILEVLIREGGSGIIATNTTLQRPGPFQSIEESGGLSGKPLHSMSLDIVRYIYRATSGKLPIIGVGGIVDIDGASQMIDRGASLVQIYTGMIYEGPFFAKEIAKALAARQKVWI